MELPEFSEVGQFWGKMEYLKDLFSSKPRFPVLCRIAKLCLTIPVANVDSERMFSILKKIHTEFRSELNNDTICALMCSNQNSLTDCFEYKPSENVLKDAKSACVAYNKCLQD